MDRYSRSMALLMVGFGSLLTTTGCKVARPEVPPGRPYSNDGRQRPAIDFSSAPHPVDGSAMTNLMPDSAGASKLAQGIGSTGDRPDMSPLLGGGKSGAFGPPGTSGRPDPSAATDDDTVRARTTPAAAEADLPAGSPDLGRPSISPNPYPGSTSPSQPSQPVSTLPANSEPQPDASAPASQVIQPPDSTTGVMGRVNDMPSPN